MKIFQTKTRLAVATAALLSSVAVATSANALSFIAAQSAGEQSTSNLVGLNVENQSGDKLGDINYLVLDNTGKVSTVVVGVGGFLGVGEKNVGVAYSDLKFSTNKDGKRIAIIDATKESLAGAPKYVWSEKSAMDKFRDEAAELANKAKNAAGMKTTSESPTKSE